MQPLFLPQIRRAGCAEIITAFARHEFGFAMKSNFHCGLPCSWIRSQQPMNARHGRRWRSSMTCRRIKFSFFMAPESVSQAIRSALFVKRTKRSLCFYRKFVGQVVMISLQLLPGLNLRPEFGFTMKSNAHCRLAGWWVCSRQPMNGGIGRRWRSVTTGRWFKVSLFIFTSPVLPQICHWPVRKSHSFVAAIFFGTLMANLGTHDGQGRNKVRFDKFPQGGKSPHLGKYFCGVIKPTADRRSNSHQ